MPVTIIRDRAPLCRTCRHPLTSWHFGADDDSERCEPCEKRAISVAVRKIVHDAAWPLIHRRPLDTRTCNAASDRSESVPRETVERHDHG